MRIAIKLPNVFKMEARYLNSSNNKCELKNLSNNVVEFKVFLKESNISILYI